VAESKASYLKKNQPDMLFRHKSSRIPPVSVTDDDLRKTNQHLPDLKSTQRAALIRQTPGVVAFLHERIVRHCYRRYPDFNRYRSQEAF
jgi:hypothetical protein